MVYWANQMKRKQKIITLVEKKAGELVKEVHEFKDKCEMLYKIHFPTLFDGNGDLYSKESLMKFLIEIRND